MHQSADVVIIGAGVIGGSTAYHLARLGVTNTVIVEMGQPGSGSSSKSASMLSLQFSADELGARMAQLAYARYMQFEQEIGVPIDFQRSGWLSVGTAVAAPALLAGSAMLRGLGIASEVLEPAEIAYRYPLLNSDDLAVGVFGPDDGPFDPHMILWGYLRRARELGARLLSGVRATGVAVQGGRVTGVHTDQGFIAAGAVINAAGPWAAEVAGWAGIDLPLRNRARTILVTGALPVVPRDHPFVEDVAAEWYFRPEGDGVLMGMGQEPVGSLEHPATDPALVDAMIDVAVQRVPALAQRVDPHHLDRRAPANARRPAHPRRGTRHRRPAAQLRLGRGWDHPGAGGGAIAGGGGHARAGIDVRHRAVRHRTLCWRQR